MFIRASFLYAVSTLAVLAVATPWGVPPPTTTTVTVTAPAPTVTTAGQCDTDDIQCCDQVTSADSADLTSILDSLGIVLGDVTGLVGLGCSPLSVVGIGSGNTCSADPVCCTDNSHGGLISIGCVPISL